MLTDWMEETGIMDGYSWVSANQHLGWEYVWNNCPSAGFYFGLLEKNVDVEGWLTKKEFILLCCDVAEYRMTKNSIKDHEATLTLKFVREYLERKCSVEKLGGWADVMFNKFMEEKNEIAGEIFTLVWTLAYVGNLSIHSEFSDEGDGYGVIEFVREQIKILRSGFPPATASMLS